MGEAAVVVEGLVTSFGDVHALRGIDLVVPAGTVVGVLDNVPETTPGGFPQSITAEKAGGNHVVVAIGGGRYAFYAHMQPGSVRVKVGQKVKVGQVLGLLGNSGNSDGPHLHFHIMSTPHPLEANGMPYRFSNFTVEGTLTNAVGIQKAKSPRSSRPNAASATTSCH